MDPSDVAQHPPASSDRHAPWVELRSASNGAVLFKRMIRRTSPDARPGSIVTVYDRHGAIFGTAHFNPHSQIALRLLCHGESAVDEAFWRQRIRQAVDLRVRQLALPEVTSAYRVIHAEGDGLPGLIVDRYDEVLSVDVTTLGMYVMIERMLPWLHDACGTRCHLVQVGERVEQLEGFKARRIASPDLPDDLRITENGVRFRVCFTTGHKTGFFCDQRDNRFRLAAFCAGADVLDVCCYTGGFGIYAKVRGKARDVTCVDLDEDAVALARRNADLNQARIQTVHADAFGYLRQMRLNGRSFDVVVLDPPKLIFGPNDAGDGRKKYFDLNRLALPLVRPGGIFLTCSCSGALRREEFVNILRIVSHQTGRTVQVLAMTGAGPDHPVHIDVPESEYLKALWLRVL